MPLEPLFVSNRVVAIIVPKAPFVAWINAADPVAANPTVTLADAQEEPSARGLGHCGIDLYGKFARQPGDLAPEFERTVQYAFAASSLRCCCCQSSPHYSMWWGLLWQLLIGTSRRYAGFAYYGTPNGYRDGISRTSPLRF
jgi:hypothetical protein